MPRLVYCDKQKGLFECIADDCDGCNRNPEYYQKRKTERIKEEICDHYCKYPNEPGHEDDWLTEGEDSPCRTCPLGRL